MSAASGVACALAHSFGRGVRQLREAQGWSQERLAENSNLNRSYIGEIERGVVIASLLTVEKLAAALKLSPAALLTHGESLRTKAEPCRNEGPDPGVVAIAC